MAKKVYRYYVGRSGPQYFESESGELPFRVEEVAYVHAPMTDPPKNVALDLPSGIGGSAGGGLNITLVVNAADFAAFQASHFYGSYLGAEML